MAQIQMAALDSSGICFYTFIFFKPGVIVSMVNALYGLHWSKEDYLAMGKEMLRQEIEFNRKAGIALEGNGLPGWLREEPLPPTGAVFDVLQEDIEKVFDF
jgi:aldehyde:ferredoxin oxidoreductase